MKIVNRVFKGRLQCANIDLNFVHENVPNSRLHMVKPAQVTVRTGCGATCIILSKGALRLMGGGVVTNCEEARAVVQNDVLRFWCHEECPQLTLQTMTAVFNLPERINLYKFNKVIASVYDFELFSALRVCGFGSVCVNLFSSGKVVLCGIKSEQQAEDIIRNIYLVYNTDYKSVTNTTE